MRYSMTQVEVLTGIKSNTLRIWERRYDILVPKRTETNIRYYSDEDLKKLLNISILLQSGIRISKIDKMSDQELIGQVLEVTKKPSDLSAIINKLVLCMIDLDEDGFLYHIDYAIQKNGLQATILNLVYPFLNHIGILWTVNKMTPAKEHFVSNLVRQKLICETATIPQPESIEKSVILFLPENEDHELGLLIANYLLRHKGYKTYYLGQNLPLDNLDEFTQNVVNPVLLTNFTTPVTDDKQQKAINKLLGFGVRLCVFGNVDHEALPEEVTYLTSPQDLLEKL